QYRSGSKSCKCIRKLIIHHIVQPQSQCKVFGAPEHNTRQYEVHERSHEIEQCHDCYDRFRKRYHDREEYTEMSCSVHLRRFIELTGDCIKISFDKESIHRYRPAHIDKYETPKRDQEADGTHKNIYCHLSHQHREQLKYEESAEAVSPTDKAVPGKCVGRQCYEYHREKR